MMTIEAKAVFHTAPREVALQTIELPPPGEDQVLIKAHHSAISPGTEGMIFDGRFPQELAQDATIPSLAGSFAYPFRYGYALVGEIIEVGANVDKTWLKRKVFTFHPHQDYAVVAIGECLPIPDGLSPLDALFLPNMESAVNFVMDAAPLLGERVLVFGQGVVGLLTCELLARFPLASLVTADPVASRRELSKCIGASNCIDPNDENAWRDLQDRLQEDGSGGFDLVIELSGNSGALNRAIEMTGFSGRILVGSWYGNKRADIDLGGHFHRRRIQLLSSQVSTMNPLLSGRWDKSRRIALAWHWLDVIKPGRWITHRFGLDRCMQAFDTNAGQKEAAFQIIFDYQDD
ncbi:zinc-binding alcohol dehydrogenase [Methylotuvimicrobium sp. KM2]|uniref:zinc-dependent alcohol dehydrogenase n=1 Tax=Methylotuvimicrobium sp. KM2 TaxID=3133976 RepID=UPI0031017CA9